MKNFQYSVALSLLLFFASALAQAQADPARIDPVGTWSVALDTGPFGFPGFSLKGLFTFHRDGTVLTADAGDFGSLGTLDTNMIGVWGRTSGGIIVVRNLMLSADPTSGEPTHWSRPTFHLTRGDDADHMTGLANVEQLNCEALLGLPAALTCPDPGLCPVKWCKSGSPFLVDLRGLWVLE